MFDSMCTLSVCCIFVLSPPLEESCKKVMHNPSNKRTLYEVEHNPSHREELHMKPTLKGDCRGLLLNPSQRCQEKGLTL